MSLYAVTLSTFISLLNRLTALVAKVILGLEIIKNPGCTGYLPHVLKLLNMKFQLQVSQKKSVNCWISKLDIYLILRVEGAILAKLWAINQKCNVNMTDSKKLSFVGQYFSVDLTNSNDAVMCKFVFVCCHGFMSGTWYNEMYITLSGSSRISHLMSGEIRFLSGSKKIKSGTSY